MHNALLLLKANKEKKLGINGGFAVSNVASALWTPHNGRWHTNVRTCLHVGREPALSRFDRRASAVAPERSALQGRGLPENARKELFSYAYMTAIAAAAGCELLVPKMDYDSLDGQVLSSEGKRPQLGVQLKATSQQCITDGHVTFPLPIKNYDDLRTEERVVPMMLVVLHLPESRDQWMTHDIDILSLRNSAYYLNLAGLPPVDNVSSVTVHIPVEQRLTSNSLQRLLDHVSEHRRLP